MPAKSDRYHNGGRIRQKKEHNIIILDVQSSQKKLDLLYIENVHILTSPRFCDATQHKALVRRQDLSVTDIGPVPLNNIAVIIRGIQKRSVP